MLALSPGQVRRLSLIQVIRRLKHEASARLADARQKRLRERQSGGGAPVRRVPKLALVEIRVKAAGGQQFGMAAATMLQPELVRWRRWNLVMCARRRSRS